jgi:hypothetical protein
MYETASPKFNDQFRVVFEAIRQLMTAARPAHRIGSVGPTTTLVMSVDTDGPAAAVARVPEPDKRGAVRGRFGPGARSKGARLTVSLRGCERVRASEDESGAPEG